MIQRGQRFSSFSLSLSNFNLKILSPILDGITQVDLALESGVGMGRVPVIFGTGTYAGYYRSTFKPQDKWCIEKKATYAKL